MNEQQYAEQLQKEANIDRLKKVYAKVKKAEADEKQRIKEEEAQELDFDREDY